MKHNKQLMGPPAHPSKRPRVEVVSNSSQQTACQNIKAFTSTTLLANQIKPSIISESSGINNGAFQGQATGLSHPSESHNETNNLNRCEEKPLNVVKRKRNDQLPGPPDPPSKHQKNEHIADPKIKVLSAVGTSGSSENQNNPCLISETSERKKEILQGKKICDSHLSQSLCEAITNFNQCQQDSSKGLNPKCVRKLRRRDLIDFFLREVEAGSCKDVLGFLGDADLVENVIVPGAISDRYKYHTKPSDVLKHIMHKVTKFCSDLQLSGWSFCGKVDISDFLVTPLGDIRMRASMIRSLKPQSSRRNRKDFRCLFRMFMKVLQRVDRIPEDLLVLLSLMKDFSEKHRILTTYNPATMPEQERLSLLDKLYRIYEALPENDDSTKAITDGVPYGNQLKKGHYLVRARMNVFLVGMLEYRNHLWLAIPAQKKERPAYPPTGRGELKLNRNSMQHAYKGLGIEKLEPGNATEDSDHKDDDTDKKKSKGKKRKPPKRKRKNLVKPIRVKKFKPFQVDHILGKAFPGLLCHFAKLMNDAGLYEEVIQDLLLPAPGDPAAPGDSATSDPSQLVIPAPDDPATNNPLQVVVHPAPAHPATSDLLEPGREHKPLLTDL